MKKYLGIYLLFAFAIFFSPSYAGRRCTGSAYCSACKNCSGCKHCNEGGGTCGVCSSESSYEEEEEVVTSKPETIVDSTPAETQTYNSESYSSTSPIKDAPKEEGGLGWFGWLAIFVAVFVALGALGSKRKK